MALDAPAGAVPEPALPEIDRLRRLALRDDLTGLANRRAFLHRLQDETERSRRSGAPFTLALLDLDGLKDLNDTFGHQAGDRALRAFARALRRSVRAADLVARIGGDEFAVIAAHRSAVEATAIADRIGRVARGMARSVAADAPPVWLSAAVGAAAWDDQAPAADHLFARAESALLAAKEAHEAPPTHRRVYRPRGRRALGEELRRLLAMARSVSSARELQQLCRTAAEGAAGLIGARHASVALRREDGRTGYDERLIDGRWVAAPGQWFAEGEGLLGRVMHTAATYIMRDVESDPFVDLAAARRLGAQDAMCVPLRAHDGSALGVLSLSNKRDEREFTPADAELAGAFADLVAAAIENVRDRERLEQAHAHVRSLMDHAQDAIIITHPVTRRILDVNGAAERISGYARDELLALRVPDLRPAEDRALPGTTDLALQADGVRAARRRLQRKDGAVIPVEVSAGTVPAPGGDVIMQLVRDISARAAAEEEGQRRHRELEARDAVAALFAGEEENDDTAALRRVLETVAGTLDADGALVARVDETDGLLRLTADLNVPEPLRSILRGRAYRPGESLLGLALIQGAVVADDLAAEAATHRGAATIVAAGIRSCALVRMSARGRVFGVLGAGSGEPGRFGATEVRLLQAVADQTALWLAHRRLLADRRRRERDALFLAGLGEALNSARDLAALVRTLARRISGVLGSATAVILFDHDSGRGEYATLYHPSRATRRRLQVVLRASLGGGATLQSLPNADRLRRPTLFDVGAPTIPPARSAALSAVGVRTILAVPMRAGGRLVGVIASAALTDDPPLTERQRDLAGAVARHAAVAIANAASRRHLLARNEDLAQREEQLRFQSQVLAAVDDAVYAGDREGRVIFWNHGAEALYGWSAAEMLGQSLDGLLPPEDGGRTGDLVRRALAGQHAEGECPRRRRDGSLVWCSVRVSALRDERGRVTGILAVARDITARRAAEAAVVAARDEAARRAAEFAAAAWVSRAIAGGGKPEAQLDSLAAHVADITGLDIVSIAVYEHERDALSLRAVHHPPAAPPPALLRHKGRHTPGVGRAHFQRALRHGQPELITGACRAPAHLLPQDHWTRAEQIETLVRVPLFYDGRPVGIINIASRDARAVSTDQLNLCRTLADQAAVAVHNLLEYERLREMRRDAILRLAAACEARDPDTPVHLHQIHATTEALAAEMGLPAEAVEEIALASVLHDVGKIRTPDAILWKPGGLSPEETMVMRLHAADGAAMLAGPAFYDTAREIARCHHERWDGSGYPAGLAGEVIPLPARIVAVADVFDALITRRSYRSARSAAQAVTDIGQAAGRLFDPRVVAAFESLWRSGRLPLRDGLVA